jgi:hypothetical protein
MSGSSGEAYPPPPPPPPSGGTWTPPPSPAGAPAAPPVPLSQRFDPDKMATRGPWRLIALASQGIGLLLVFLGTLLTVVFGYIPVSCIGSTSGCGSNPLTGMADAIIAGRALWALGLLGLAGGSAIHLQVVPRPSSPLSPEETRIYLARRRGEYVVLVLSIVLLFVLLLYSTFGFAFVTPT